MNLIEIANLTSILLPECLSQELMSVTYFMHSFLLLAVQNAARGEPGNKATNIHIVDFFI